MISSSISRRMVSASIEEIGFHGIKDTVDVGEINEASQPEGHGDPPGHQVGIDVVRTPLLSHPDRRNDRNESPIR